MGFFDRIADLASRTWNSIKSAAATVFTAVSQAAKKVVAVVKDVGAVVGDLARRAAHKLGEALDSTARWLQGRRSAAFERLLETYRQLAARIREALLDADTLSADVDRYQRVVALSRLLPEFERILREARDLAEIKEYVRRTIEAGDALIEGGDGLTDAALDALNSSVTHILHTSLIEMAFESLLIRAVDAMDVTRTKCRKLMAEIDSASVLLNKFRRLHRAGEAKETEVTAQSETVSRLEATAEIVKQRVVDLELVGGVMSWLQERAATPNFATDYAEEIAAIQVAVQSFLQRDEMSILTEGERDALGSYAVIGMPDVEKRIQDAHRSLVAVTQ